MRRVLVTGAGGSAGINFIKCLKLAGGYFIIGTDINRWHLELPNVDERYILPNCSSSNYISRLNHLIEKRAIEFLHPQPDVEVEVISENRERIKAKTFLPAKQTVRTLHDKWKTNTILRKNDVPAPRSYLISGTDPTDDMFKELSGREGVVWLRAVRGAGSRAALPASNRVLAHEWIKYWLSYRALESEQFMMSEFLPGKEYAFQSLWKDGELITSAARTRLEYLFGNLNPSGQSSSPAVAKTVHNKELNKIAASAVTAVDEKANGVFCVDLKEDGKGVPNVTEINVGRFFTTSDFFANLGCNMPDMLVKLAFGERIQDMPKFDAVPADYYWVRLMDGGPILIKEGDWSSLELP
jgi:carbamoyl-phosphate synthase large subunit